MKKTSDFESKPAKRVQKVKYDLCTRNHVALEHAGADTVPDTRQELKYPPTREVMTTPRRAPKEGSAKGGPV